MKYFLSLSVFAFLLAGCTEPAPETPSEQYTQTETTKTTVETPAETPAKTTSSNPSKTMTQRTPESVTELEITTIKEGTGAPAKAGDRVLVHYTGTFLDGKKFDSSRDRNDPFSLTLGAQQVIEGWDTGLQGMKVGELRNLLIPYEMAYGESGFPGAIPPKTPLMFEVELLEIQ